MQTQSYVHWYWRRVFLFAIIPHHLFFFFYIKDVFACITKLLTKINKSETLIRLDNHTLYIFRDLTKLFYFRAWNNLWKIKEFNQQENVEKLNVSLQSCIWQKTYIRIMVKFPFPCLQTGHLGKFIMKTSSINDLRKVVKSLGCPDQ